MAYINQWNLSGNVGRDAELKTSKAGTQYADFSLAVNSKGEGGEDETMWVKVYMYGKNAERAVNFCKKGANVYVTGPLKKRKYTKRDGSEAVEDSISANNFTILRHVPWASNDQVYTERKEAEMVAAQGIDFDIPI